MSLFAGLRRGVARFSLNRILLVSAVLIYFSIFILYTR